MPQTPSPRFVGAVFTFSHMEAALAGYDTCFEIHTSLGSSMNQADLRLILDFELAKIAVTAKIYHAYERALHRDGFDFTTTFAMIRDDAFPELGPDHDPDGGGEMRFAA